MNVAYIRVSTAEQNEERQVKALESYNIDRWFTEKISGKNTDRPQLKEMLSFVRDGDTVFVHDWSRLSRSASDLLRLIEKLEKKNVKMVSLKENFNTSSPTGKLMLGLIALVNEFERTNLLERQAEGILIAKQQGKYTGRKLNKYDEKVLEEIMRGIATKTITVTDSAKKLGVTRTTVYNILHRHEKERDANNEYKRI